MIIEGIITTLNPDGTVNVAPMGPRTDETLSFFHLRPFQSSTTFQNIQRTRQAVFHITDDAGLIARAAIQQRLDPFPETVVLDNLDVPRLADTCRWFALAAESIDDSAMRAEIPTHIIQQGDVRPFWGFNRARHAVLEAAILATRVHLIPAEQLRDEFARLWPAVEKTGGPAEHRAMHFLEESIGAALEGGS